MQKYYVIQFIGTNYKIAYVGLTEASCFAYISNAIGISEDVGFSPKEHGYTVAVDL